MHNIMISKKYGYKLFLYMMNGCTQASMAWRGVLKGETKTIYQQKQSNDEKIHSVKSIAFHLGMFVQVLCNITALKPYRLRDILFVLSATLV